MGASVSDFARPGRQVLCTHGDSATTPSAIGAVLMVMIYAGGHLSGGHSTPQSLAVRFGDGLRCVMVAYGRAVRCRAARLP